MKTITLFQKRTKTLVLSYDDITERDWLHLTNGSDFVEFYTNFFNEYPDKCQIIETTKCSNVVEFVFEAWFMYEFETLPDLSFYTSLENEFEFIMADMELHENTNTKITKYYHKLDSHLLLKNTVNKLYNDLEMTQINVTSLDYPLNKTSDIARFELQSNIIAIRKYLNEVNHAIFG